MFDVVRLTVLVWAAMSIARIRSWALALPVMLAVYVLFLELFSGLTVRDQGAQPPAMVMLLIFFGPAGMPRGPLPPLPLAHLVVVRQSLVDLACAALLFCAAHLLTRRIERAPEYASNVLALHRTELAVTFAAVVTALAAGVVALPTWLSER